MSAWHEDPVLKGRFHPDCPDDIQVMVHEGEPRRTQRPPEGCWVRVQSTHGSLRWPVTAPGQMPPLRPDSVAWEERTVYAGELLNAPHGLPSTPKGSRILFLFAKGLPLPLRVTEQYLAERSQWALTPCNACGANHTLDPPTVMARTRFPDAPPGAVPVAFSAFCPCGGTMMLGMVEGAHAAPARPAPGGGVAAAGEADKPWWKFW